MENHYIWEILSPKLANRDYKLKVKAVTEEPDGTNVLGPRQITALRCKGGGEKSRRVENEIRQYMYATETKGYKEKEGT